MKTRKWRRALALAMALMTFALLGVCAQAAAKTGAQAWVGYNSKYDFYLLDKEDASSLIRIDATGKDKTLYTRKQGLHNILYCDERYVYVTGETTHFKPLASDKEDEETQYGVIHIDLIRVDAETGKATTIRSNLRHQLLFADASYFYYTADGKNTLRMKHDGTGSAKYMSYDAFFERPQDLPNGARFAYNYEKETTTITRKDGTKKTISGYPYVGETHLFAWEHQKTDGEYRYTLYRYDLNGDKKAKIPALANHFYTDLVYGKGAFYFVEESGNGYVVKKMTTNGKVTTFHDASSQVFGGNYPGIYIAKNWLFLYDDVESNGQWGQFLSKHKM